MPNLSIDTLFIKQETPCTRWHLERVRLLLFQITQSKQPFNPHVQVCALLAIDRPVIFVDLMMHQQLVLLRIASESSVRQLLVFYFSSLVESGIPKVALVCRQERFIVAERAQYELEHVMQRLMTDCSTSVQVSGARGWDEGGQGIGKQFHGSVTLVHDTAFAKREE